VFLATVAELGAYAAVVTALGGTLAVVIDGIRNRGSVRISKDQGKQKLLDGIIDALAADRERQREELIELRTRLDDVDGKYDTLMIEHRTLRELHLAETSQLRDERDEARREADSLRARVEQLEQEVAELRNAAPPG